MPHRSYSPAYLRYFKARLWNLARPSFWVTAIFLSVVGLAIKEYWTHPDFLTQEPKQPVVPHQPINSSLSREDKAIAADIDSLPVLYNEAGATALPPTASSYQVTTQASNSKLLDQLKSKTQVDTSVPKANAGVDTANSLPTLKLENPFLTQAQNLLQVGFSQTDNKLMGVNASNSPSVQPGVAPNNLNSVTGLTTPSLYSSPSTPPVSLSQPGFNQSATQNLPGINTNTVSQPGFNQSATQNLPGINTNTMTVGQNAIVGQSPSINYSPNPIYPPTTGSSQNLMNPVPVPIGGYAQPRQINQPQSTYPILNPYRPNYNQVAPTNQLINPYSSLNTYSREGQARYVLNQLLNGYPNATSTQALPPPMPSTQVVSPTTTTVPGYTTPYYTQQPQSQGVVSPTNPAVGQMNPY